MKSANVTVRVEPDVKEKAEAILNELGIPTSTAINMFYRQIVLWMEDVFARLLGEIDNGKAI